MKYLSLSKVKVIKYLGLISCLLLLGCECRVRAGVGQTAPVFTSTVTMTNSRFEPKVIKVYRGTSVTWRNTSTYWHNVNLGEVISPFLRPGSEWIYTFKEPGTYEYKCDPHATMGMVGTVIVQ